jgi:hypothetical protein
MEILAQPLCETVFTPTTFRHTKRLPIRISRPSHKKFHFKNIFILFFVSHLHPAARQFCRSTYTIIIIIILLLILPSLRPWGVAARHAILENRCGKSHFCDYFIIRARYVYLSYYRKCRASILYIFHCLCFFVRSIVS